MEGHLKRSDQDPRQCQKREFVAREKYDRINTPKNGTILYKTYDSYRRCGKTHQAQYLKTVHLFQSSSPFGGFNVRTDQNDQNIDFEYPSQNLSRFNLGTPKSHKNLNSGIFQIA